MKATIIPYLAAASIALTATALAQTVEPELIQTSVARLRASPQVLSVSYITTIEFQHGATIDFADMTQQPPGPLRGYVYVRMQGELVLIPVYQPTSDGTMWRIAPTTR